MKRLWRLLDAVERRRVLSLTPLLVVSAFVEVVGVAAVIPFLAILTDPASARDLPLVGGWIGGWAGEDAVELLRWAGLALALLLVAANGLVMATNWWLYRFTWGLNHAISARLLRRYLAQPYGFLLTHNTAHLANRVVTDVRQVVDEGVRSGLEIVTRSLMILALVAFLVLLEPVKAIVAFVLLGTIYAAIFYFSRRYLRRLGRESVTTGAARLKAVQEALSGWKVLRAAGREAEAYEQYLQPSRRYGEVQASAMAIGALPRHALEAVAVGGLVLIASVMVGRGQSAVGTVPLLGAYAFAAMRIMPAMQNMFRALARIRFASGALDAVTRDLRREAGLEAIGDDPEPLPFARSIELRDVSYTYPAGDGPALHGVSLKLERNERLAIVGRTGSGKTTLVDALLGLLEPQLGEVVVDGVPVTGESRRAYRRLFGYVPQSVYLLDDTITRNVAFGLGDDRIDHEAVRRACRQAQISDFIERTLPLGYETKVGERGVRLSGGQIQRIGIARALYHQPQVLVFDEATSALDVHTEDAVFAALEDIARERTVVTIAHRLETVAKADQAIVLEEGRVVDAGAADTVLERYRFAGAASG